MSDEILVRIARPDDLELVMKAADGVFDNQPDSTASLRFIESESTHLALALDGEQVVGMASAVTYSHPDKPEPELFLNEIGVAPEYQRSGIGRALVQTMLEHAATLGCNSAWTITHRGNTAAKGMFAAAGGAAESDALMIELPVTGAD